MHFLFVFVGQGFCYEHMLCFVLFCCSPFCFFPFKKFFIDIEPKQKSSIVDGVKKVDEQIDIKNQEVKNTEEIWFV